jgi:hypothetical protein
MPRRTALIFGAVIALLVIVLIVRSPNDTKSSNPSLAGPAHNKPMPAGDPTVTPPPSKEKTDNEKPKVKPAKDDHELSSLGAEFRKKVAKVVRIYASWPGDTSRTKLLELLEQEEPLITDDAIDRIEEVWSNTPLLTFKVNVKHVNLDPELSADFAGASDAVLMAYVTLAKRFTPVSGKPYNEKATQTYEVHLEIIQRKWRIVGINPLTVTESKGA